jgi:hypothetical protein
MTLPSQVRAEVGYDRRPCAAVFDAFAKELPWLFAELQRRGFRQPSAAAWGFR